MEKRVIYILKQVYYHTFKTAGAVQHRVGVTELDTRHSTAVSPTTDDHTLDTEWTLS